MKTLKETVEQLIQDSEYTKACNIIADKFGIKLKVISSSYGKYFTDDKQNRHIFKLRLLRGRKSYTFNFGQSIAEGSNKPSLYDVLSCLQKYDVGSFEDFCSEFGYDEDSKSAEKIYKAVVKEYEAMSRLFTNEEIEVLNEIN